MAEVEEGQKESTREDGRSERTSTDAGKHGGEGGYASTVGTGRRLSIQPARGNTTYTRTIQRRTEKKNQLTLEMQTVGETVLFFASKGISDGRLYVKCKALCTLMYKILSLLF